MATRTLPVAIAPRMLADEIRVQTPPGSWRMRRRLYTPPPSSPPTTTTTTMASSTVIVGHAHLCFCEDGSWFEGHLIVTADNSQYGLIGKLCDSNSTKNLGDDDDLQSPSTTTTTRYDVSVLDHDAGETYVIHSVDLTTTNDCADHRLCSLTSSRIKFAAQKSSRGQMADIIIQRYLTPSLVGKHLRVYAGQMSVDLAQLENLDSPSEKRMWYN